MAYGDASMACVAYRRLVFTDKEGVCEKGVADSNAGDSNILASVEVRRCKPLFHRTFYVLPLLCSGACKVLAPFQMLSCDYIYMAIRQYNIYP